MASRPDLRAHFEALLAKGGQDTATICAEACEELVAAALREERRIAGVQRTCSQMAVLVAAASYEDPPPEGSAVEAARKVTAIVGGVPKVCILGSGRFHSTDSPAFVSSLAQDLCERLRDRAALVTHGMRGVQRTFAESCSAEANLFTLVPAGQRSGLRTGTDVAAGSDWSQSGEALGLLGDVYIVVEGGPRAAELARAGAERGATVLPIARLGGAGSGMFGLPASLMHRPRLATHEQWDALSKGAASVEEAAAAASAIVLRCVEEVEQAAAAAARELPAAWNRGFFDDKVRHLDCLSSPANADSEAGGVAGACGELGLDYTQIVTSAFKVRVSFRQIDQAPDKGTSDRKARVCSLRSVVKKVQCLQAIQRGVTPRPDDEREQPPAAAATAAVAAAATAAPVAGASRCGEPALVAQPAGPVCAALQTTATFAPAAPRDRGRDFGGSGGEGSRGPLAYDVETSWLERCALGTSRGSPLQMSPRAMTSQPLDKSAARRQITPTRTILNQPSDKARFEQIGEGASRNAENLSRTLAELTCLLQEAQIIPPPVAAPPARAGCAA